MVSSGEEVWAGGISDEVMSSFVVVVQKIVDGRGWAIQADPFIQFPSAPGI
jgi:hypothetical protein